MRTKAQVGIEYIIIFGFLTFILITIMSIAFFYSSGIKDRLKTAQVNNYANKIIATSETVFYYGNPSKATIRVYLPEGIQNIEFHTEGLIIETQLNSGISRSLYSTNIQLQGNLSNSPGIQNVEIIAQDDRVLLSTMV